MMQSQMFGLLAAFFLSSYISNRPLEPETSKPLVKRWIRHILEKLVDTILNNLLKF
jgi:hypothetical protein